MELIGITDEIILKLHLKSLNKLLLESTEPRKISMNEFDLNALLRFNHRNEDLSEFLRIFQERFSEEQYNHMLSQLLTLKLIEEQREKSNYSSIMLGDYDADENRMYLYRYKDRRIDREQERETFYHELIHMASTKKVNEIAITGFAMTNYFGVNLNEGYTEYLTEKYFTRGNKYVYNDDIKIYFAIGNENIVGKEKMQELYFNADLEGLIKELSKHMKRNDAIKLIYSLDRQYQVLSTNKDKIRIINAIANITEKKLLRDYYEGTITYEEYQIEHAKKVDGYKKGILWSEETKVIKDEDTFILYDQGYSSGIYELRRPRIFSQKKYQ